MRETSFAAVFAVLTLLDGVSGRITTEGPPADFAVYLQTYESEDAFWKGAAAARVRINPQSKTAPELHDLFKELIEDS